MIRVVPWLVAAACLTAGCSWFRHGEPATAGAGAAAAYSTTITNGAGTMIVTADASPKGRVAKVDLVAQFAVLVFPTGAVPGKDERVFVYRQGLKIGELKVTGPTDGDITVANIVAGEAQVNDEIRMR